MTPINDHDGRTLHTFFFCETQPLGAVELSAPQRALRLVYPPLIRGPTNGEGGKFGRTTLGPRTYCGTKRST